MTGENKIEITDRQRERLDEIKAECTGEGLGELPEPSDQMTLSSLLDTWDAVSEGVYTKNRKPDDRDIDDISAVDECASCEWSPAAIVLTDDGWECYNCGGDHQ